MTDHGRPRGFSMFVMEEPGLTVCTFVPRWEHYLHRTAAIRPTLGNALRATRPPARTRRAPIPFGCACSRFRSSGDPAPDSPPRWRRCGPLLLGRRWTEKSSDGTPRRSRVPNVSVLVCTQRIDLTRIGLRVTLVASPRPTPQHEQVQEHPHRDRHDSSKQSCLGPAVQECVPTEDEEGRHGHDRSEGDSPSKTHRLRWHGGVTLAVKSILRTSSILIGRARLNWSFLGRGNTSSDHSSARVPGFAAEDDLRTPSLLSGSIPPARARGAGTN